jgi:hypothetical protein
LRHARNLGHLGLRHAKHSLSDVKHRVHWMAIVFEIELFVNAFHSETHCDA